MPVKVITFIYLLATPIAAQSSVSEHGRCGGGVVRPHLGFDRLDCALCTMGSDSNPRFEVEPTIRQVRTLGPKPSALEEGDVLVAVDGQPMTRVAAVSRLLSVHVGETLHLSVRRDGRLLEVDVPVATLCASPSQPTLPFEVVGGMAANPPTAGRPKRASFGLSFWCVGRCAEPTRDGGRTWLFSSPPRIAGVVPGSRASRMGLRVDDIVLEIDGVSTTTETGTARFLALGSSTGDRLLVERAGERMTLRVRDE